MKKHKICHDYEKPYAGLDIILQSYTVIVEFCLIIADDVLRTDVADIENMISVWWGLYLVVLTTWREVLCLG